MQTAAADGRRARTAVFGSCRTSCSSAGRRPERPWSSPEPPSVTRGRRTMRCNAWRKLQLREQRRKPRGSDPDPATAHTPILMGHLPKVQLRVHRTPSSIRHRRVLRVRSLSTTMEWMRGRLSRAVPFPHRAQSPWGNVDGEGAGVRPAGPDVLCQTDALLP